MTFFEKISRKLFPGDKLKPAVDVHEVLKRPERDRVAYEAWRNEPECETLVREVAQAYYYKKTNINSELEVHLLNTAYANGFAVSYVPRVPTKEFQHLFEYFKDQVAGMGYRVVNADRRIKDKANFVETIEKYYLKPPLHRGDIKAGSIDQLYGNVAVEHVLINDRPSYIKVQASIYSDRLYQDAQHFDDFADRLFAG
ncbi:MAG: hypothetical protein WA960_04060 [Tunicatimonas sp.]